MGAKRMEEEDAAVVTANSAASAGSARAQTASQKSSGVPRRTAGNAKRVLRRCDPRPLSLHCVVLMSGSVPTLSTPVSCDSQVGGVQRQKERGREMGEEKKILESEESPRRSRHS